MRISLQRILLVVLVGVAVLYFAFPARAAESCAWVTEMQEDEGWSVLTTSTCSEDASQTPLQFRCFGDILLIEFDLAIGSEAPAEGDEAAEVAFVVDGGTQTVPMQFVEMTAFFAGEVPLDGPLTKLLKSGKSLEVRDTAGVYQPKTYSLAGSSAALKALVDACY